MRTIQIDLPEPLEAYVEARVAEGGYGSAGDYVRALILAERAGRVGGESEGPASGPAGRRGGQWRGRVKVAADFDELPGDITDAFGLGPG